MPIVNYVREHERFIEYASDEQLSANEMLLWYALMHVFNQRAEGHEWPDGFIRIRNDRLLTYCPMRWDAMARARNRLKQRGRIDYRNGNRNSEAPSYRIIYFYPDVYPLKTDNMRDNIRDNIGGNIGDNIRDNIRDNIGDMYININKNQTYTQTESADVDHDDDDDVSRAREDAEASPDPIPDRLARENAVCVSFLENIGREPMPAEVGRLVCGSWAQNMGPDMIALAIRTAGQNGAANPAAYALSVMSEWRSADVLQPHQVTEHKIEYDQISGRNPALRGRDDDIVGDLRAIDAAREKRYRENTGMVAT